MLAKKLKCRRQQLQNLTLFLSCTWFTIRSRGVPAASAKSRYWEKYDVELNVTLSWEARRRRAARFATACCYTIGRNLGTVSSP